jgi:hypothetical protein
MAFRFWAICDDCGFRLFAYTQKQILDYVRNHKKECKDEPMFPVKTVKKVKNKYGMWVAE